MSSPLKDPPARGSAYAWYVLGLLCLVTAFNVADRNILGVLLEPIKTEFGASDTMMGLLVGTFFAVVHIVASVLIATWADRGVRRTIVAGGLFIWSGLTVLSGMARSFWELAAARFGVGAAEGTGSAPAHSLLCDYFPIEQRARVMTLFGIGGMVGIVGGFILGGTIAEAHGWRAAFFVLGIPGTILAGLVWLTVREPERGRLDGGTEGRPVSTWTAVRHLGRTRSFTHMVLAASYHAFASMGSGPFYISYLMRSHDARLGDAAIGIALGPQFVAAGAAFLFAWVCDRLGQRDVRWYMWIPTWGAILALPFSLAFLLWPAGQMMEIAGRAVPFALLWLIPASMLGAAWNGPTLAMTQSVAPPIMRSRASALTTGTYNLIGMGLGPLVVGLVSDLLQPRLGVESLRYALLVIGLMHVLGALHTWLAARHLRADLEALRGS